MSKSNIENSKLTNPKAILFDWDNTLADSWEIIHNSLRKTFIDMGHEPWSMEETKDRIHKSLRDSFPVIFGDKAEIAGEKYLRYFRESHLDNLKVLDGAEKLLEKLYKTNIYLAVVSNKTGVSLRKEVDKLNWNKYFSKVIGAKDADEDKPSIKPVIMALEDSGLNFQDDNMWFVGDSLSDIECARNCGIVSVFFGGDDLSKDKYKNNQPDIHFKNHDEFIKYVDNKL